MKQTWLGIDIGGTSTRLLMMDDQHQWLGFHKIATSSWSQANNALPTLATLIQSVLENQQVNGVMIGLPGILSRDRQQVLSLPFIQALDNQPAAQLLTEMIGIPVAMDKDVNHLMLWDLMQLEHLPQNAVGLYLGTGMGNSLWLNGHFYYGAYGGAGELGHIPLVGSTSADREHLCPCGNFGCAETTTSGHWLSNWAHLNVPDTPMSQLFTQHHNHPELKDFIKRLAKIAATEMNILDPECLILGGGVLSMIDFPLASLREQIVQHLRPPVTRNGLKIIFSDSTDHTGCRGACLAAERHFGRIS
ncbi:sugar kinase [Chania multitudinisentens RB-25]|uniref:Sugar kinase n=1 Tax=Chania multitudinisentens RB-25 TaxID=1441930 RepID=W0L6U6_9GAMM|nr:allose kinase [Chania multitudinisentens]AHG19523.1 sugar kinase [Chania multitudinisentens RB-25]